MINSTIVKVPKKYQSMIHAIEKDQDGYWAYSKAGFHFSYMGGGVHTASENDKRNLLIVIRSLEKCDCDWCRDTKANKT